MNSAQRRMSRNHPTRYDPGMNTSVRIIVNGQPQQVEQGLSIADLLAGLELKPQLVAVERNGEIVPRLSHSEVLIQMDDRFEIVTLVGGG